MVYNTPGNCPERVVNMLSTPRRWLWHVSAGLCLAAAAWFMPKMPFLVSLAVVTLLFLAFELLRLRVSGMNRWFFSHFGSILRLEESSRLTTASYVLVAALVAYLAFGRDIAVLSVCFLAVGDVAAAVVGQRLGRTRLFGKALEGDLACLIACLGTGFVLHCVGLDLGLMVILAGSVAAAIGQAIRTPMDDNLTLPLFAGAVMAAVPG